MVKFTETGNRIVVYQGHRRADVELLFNVYRASVWNDEKVLEKDSGNSCTIP